MSGTINTGPFKGGADAMTTGQIARACGVAPRTVAEWFDAGTIRGYLVGNHRRVPRHEVVRFMRERGIPLGVLGVRDAVLCCGLTEQLFRDLGHYLPGWDQHGCGDAVTAGRLAERNRPQAVVVGPGLDWSQRLVPDALKDMGARLVAVVGDDCLPSDWLTMGYDAVFKESADPRAVAAAVTEDRCQTNHLPPRCRRTGRRTGGDR